MLTQKTEEMLSIFLVIKAAKDAVQRFEQGEINAREAVRLIIEAGTQVRAG